MSVDADVENTITFAQPSSSSVHVHRPHEIVKDALATGLAAEGFTVMKEALIGKRRVDLVAQKDTQILIIEVVDTHQPKPLLLSTKEINVLEVSLKVYRMRYPSQ